MPTPRGGATSKPRLALPMLVVWATCASLALLAGIGCSDSNGDGSREAAATGAAATNSGRAVDAREAAGRRVLVFASRDGALHGDTEPVIAEVERAARSIGFESAVSRQAGDLDETGLAEYAALVLVHESGAVLDARARQEIERFVQAGGGLALVHVELGSEHDWAWLHERIGAARIAHAPRRERTLRFAADEGSTTATLRIEDGWHTLPAPPPRARILTRDAAGTAVSWLQPGPPAPAHADQASPAAREGALLLSDLGHSQASFQNEVATARLAAGLAAIAALEPLDYARAAPPLHAWRRDIWPAVLEEPIAFALLPDGSALVTQRRGSLVRIEPGTPQPQTLARFEVAKGSEVGLLGLALDPSFARTGWLYLFRTRPAEDDGPPHHRVSRFTYDRAAHTLEPASERIVIEIPTEAEDVPHRGGSLAIGSDGLLYIGLGDETYMAGNNYAPLDARPGRALYDAARTAGDASDLRGAILRIRPLEQGGYAIPPGNLFPAHATSAGASSTGPAQESAPSQDGDDSRSDRARPEIYAMGVRNPFTLQVPHARAARVRAPEALIWGDVGPDALHADPLRGPRGYDEVNRTEAAGNFGWPFFIAGNEPYRAFDFATHASGPVFEAAAPRNQSPRNRGPRELPPAEPATLAYANRPHRALPELGAGPRSVVIGGAAGPAPGEARAPGALPARYDGALLLGDFMRGHLIALRDDDAGRPIAAERLGPPSELSGLVALRVAAGGRLFLLEYGTQWYAAGPDARLSQLVYDPATGIESTPETAQPARSISGADADGRAALAVRGSRSFFRDDGEGSDGAWLELADATTGSSLRVVYEPSGEELAAGRAALRTEGCTGCHASSEAPRVGAPPRPPSAPPSFAEIARHYTGRDVDVDSITARIAAGSVGVFGNRGMPPQPQIPTALLREMVSAIVLPEAEPRRAIPLAGRIALRAHRERSVDFGSGRFYRGRYLVEPTPAAGAARSHALRLRHHRLLAIDHDGSAGYGRDARAIEYVGVPTMTPEAEGAWLRFAELDLRGEATLAVHIPSERSGAGGAIELRSGAADGPLLGDRLELIAAAGDLTIYEISIDPIEEGLVDVYLVFRHERSSEPPAIVGLSFGAKDAMLTRPPAP